MRRPRIRYATFRASSSTPSGCAASSCWSSSTTAPAGPGSSPPSRGWWATTSSTSSTRSRSPTLIVWGRNDRIVPPQDAIDYGRHLRNSRTVIFDDTGHLPQLERPVRFNRVLETFLAE